MSLVIVRFHFWVSFCKYFSRPEKFLLRARGHKMLRFLSLVAFVTVSIFRRFPERNSKFLKIFYFSILLFLYVQDQITNITIFIDSISSWGRKIANRISTQRRTIYQLLRIQKDDITAPKVGIQKLRNIIFCGPSLFISNLHILRSSWRLLNGDDP